MRFLLDTNACIALLNQTSQALAARMREQLPSDIGLPAATVFELYYGAYGGQTGDYVLHLRDDG